jgi:hypothetical protein
MVLNPLGIKDFALDQSSCAQTYPHNLCKSAAGKVQCVLPHFCALQKFRLESLACETPSTITNNLIHRKCLELGKTKVFKVGDAQVCPCDRTYTASATPKQGVQGRAFGPCLVFAQDENSLMNQAL